MAQARALMPEVTYAEDAYACAEGADALVIVTEWNAFRALDLGRLARIMNTPVMVDLRNIYRSQDVRAKGFSYRGIGTDPGTSEPDKA